MSSVIIGATRVEQLEQNVRATGILLDDQDLGDLGSVSQLPREYPGWLRNAKRD